jgi:hypothetical protein
MPFVEMYQEKTAFYVLRHSAASGLPTANMGA